MKSLHCIVLLLITLNFSAGLQAQEVDSSQVARIINTLASDDMRGRKAGTKDALKAAEFIAQEFEAIGLEYFDKLDTYFQEFEQNGQEYRNVVGVIPGSSKKNEYVLFSAHYDHIGILNARRRMADDSIANGADDDASGVTAVIELARYYKALANNERTLVFVAFTAEEIGGFGSRYFSEQIQARQYIAGINIEMIGKLSKFGKKAVFITGYDKSNLGKILQSSLEGRDTDFQFKADPYPSQNLFYRSDNARFALLGIPAHSFSSVQIDKDRYYHSVKDEVSTLSISNMRDIIQNLAWACEALSSGDIKPSRIKDK